MAYLHSGQMSKKRPKTRGQLKVAGVWYASRKTSSFVGVNTQERGTSKTNGWTKYAKN
jgi:hypothetical protein